MGDTGVSLDRVDSRVLQLPHTRTNDSNHASCIILSDTSTDEELSDEITSSYPLNEPVILQGNDCCSFDQSSGGKRTELDFDEKRRAKLLPCERGDYRTTVENQNVDSRSSVASGVVSKTNDYEHCGGDSCSSKSSGIELESYYNVPSSLLNTGLFQKSLDSTNSSVVGLKYRYNSPSSFPNTGYFQTFSDQNQQKLQYGEEIFLETEVQSSNNTLNASVNSNASTCPLNSTFSAITITSPVKTVCTFAIESSDLDTKNKTSSDSILESQNVHNHQNNSLKLDSETAETFPTCKTDSSWEDEVQKNGKTCFTSKRAKSHLINQRKTSHEISAIYRNCLGSIVGSSLRSLRYSLHSSRKVLLAPGKSRETGEDPCECGTEIGACLDKILEKSVDSLEIDTSPSTEKLSSFDVETVIPFDKIMNLIDPNDVCKIGEGSFSEVYKVGCSTEQVDAEKCILKVIALTDEFSKESAEGEFQIAYTLSQLCSNYVKFFWSRYLSGRCPEPLLEAWNRFHQLYPEESLNTSPSELAQDSCFCVMAMEYAGTPFADFKFKKFDQAVSIIQQLGEWLSLCMLFNYVLSLHDQTSSKHLNGCCSLGSNYAREYLVLARYTKNILGTQVLTSRSFKTE